MTTGTQNSGPFKRAMTSYNKFSKLIIIYFNVFYVWEKYTNFNVLYNIYERKEQL